MDPGYEEIYAAVEERHPWFVARRRLFAALAGPSRSPRVLDVGCGTGLFLCHLKALGFERLAGVESSEGMQARFRDPSIELFDELPDRRFDLVFLLDVLEHLDDDRAALAGIVELLEPGGRLLLSVPAHPSLWSRHDEVNRHRRRYRRRELEEKLRGAGLEIERLAWWNLSGLPAAWLARRPGARRGRSNLELGGRLGLALYGGLLAAEGWLLLRTGLPAGLSLVAEAVRPREAAARPAPRG